jgi:hypothetical protein
MHTAQYMEKTLTWHLPVSSLLLFPISLQQSGQLHWPRNSKMTELRKEKSLSWDFAFKFINDISTTTCSTYCIMRILWHTDAVLWNKQMRQWLLTDSKPTFNNGSTVGSGVFYVVCSEVISHGRPS